MKTVQTVADLHHTLAPQWQRNTAIGFIPTMGALHAGHLSLVKRARDDSELVVASIFVNPKQFGPNEDLARYPRMPEQDQTLLESTGVDVLFMPSADEVYPPGFSTRIEVGQLGNVLEGASRPGFFGGVATVVAKLFTLVRPTRAYFGQKDAQQLALIRRMVRDLNIPVEIVAIPTVREADGLAMSSRNTYLSASEREAATVLYHALTAAAECFNAGERNGEELRRVIHETMAREPLATLDYGDVVDATTMEQLEIVGTNSLLVIAARIGQTRLIDNLPLQ